MDTTEFSLSPDGPFDLAAQAAHFGGWPHLPDASEAIVMAFPLEQGGRSAAVVVRQAGKLVSGQVYGVDDAEQPKRAWAQAQATLSLDADGSGWPRVGARDPAIGELQARYGPLRPTLFHSPYEAATGFVIGHRISIRQARATRQRIADELGEHVEVAGSSFPAFPSPDRLLRAREIPGVTPVKVERLREIAAAALEGWMTREGLRAVGRAEATVRLRALPGIGPFFADGIYLRGAGAVDELSEDEVSRFALGRLLGRESALRTAEYAEHAERWRPYRMWAGVLLNVWARSELELPSRRRRNLMREQAPRRGG